ncbi:MAG: hypothetical protein NZ529_09470 [Cytophagaceae bacterium]|nr:hypothetical protein [Cytophagaceae bacterium]MDW8457014.1 hypothetical protein [Cytophagaceae bacterium]
MKSKIHLKLILFCVGNALFLTLFSFLWLNHSYFITGDEEQLIRITSGIKNTFFKLSERPSSNELLFVDIAWEKQLNDIKDNNGQIIGKRAITNRKRIAQYLNELNKLNHHKFIILDVYFKDSSDYESDKMLQDALNKTKNILIPYHMDAETFSKPQYPIFKAPMALSDYEKHVVENKFMKFKLMHGTNYKTTPLVMYEMLHNDEFKSNGWIHTMQNRPAMNSFILDFRIWTYNITADEQSDLNAIDTTRYTKLYLSDILGDNLARHLPVDPNMPPEVAHAMKENILSEYVAEQVKNFSKDRIIVIGDFSDTDIHETIYGPTAGPLILLNIYLALKAGDNIFHFGFLIFLFTGFLLLSYKCYTHNDIIETFIARIIPNVSFRKYIIGFMGYLIYFLLLSIICYFLFNIHITILVLAIYMELMENVLKYLKKRKQQ